MRNEEEDLFETRMQVSSQGLHFQKFIHLFKKVDHLVVTGNNEGIELIERHNLAVIFEFILNKGDMLAQSTGGFLKFTISPRNTHCFPF